MDCKALLRLKERAILLKQFVAILKSIAGAPLGRMSTPRKEGLRVTADLVFSWKQILGEMGRSQLSPRILKLIQKALSTFLENFQSGN